MLLPSHGSRSNAISCRHHPFINGMLIITILYLSTHDNMTHAGAQLIVVDQVVLQQNIIRVLWILWLSMLNGMFGQGMQVRQGKIDVFIVYLGKENVNMC